MGNLNPKQDRFCSEYLADLNATQAAIRAGYSPRTARSIGAENLTKPDIQMRIATLRQERVDRTRITADRILQELAVIAFANVGDFLRWSDAGIELIPRDKIDIAKLGAVESLTVAQNGNHRGFKLKLKNCIHALDLLGRHLGMFTGNPIAQKRSEEEVHRELFAALEQARERLARRAEKARDTAAGE